MEDLIDATLFNFVLNNEENLKVLGFWKVV